MRSFHLALLLAVIAVPLRGSGQAPDHTPAAQHAALMKLAGEYDAHTKYYGTAGQAPAESRGVTVLTPVLGGRFLLQEDFDKTRSGPPSGIRMYGFNVAARQYEATWSYIRSTGLLTMKGRSEDGGRSIQFRGRWEEGEGRFRALNATLRLIDERRFAIEVSGDTPQDPRVETTFTRRSSGPAPAPLPRP
jgi:hypothetical protein